MDIKEFTEANPEADQVQARFTGNFGHKRMLCERCQCKAVIYPKVNGKYLQRLCSCGGPLVPIKRSTYNEGPSAKRFCGCCKAQLRRGNTSARCAVCQNRAALQSIHV